MWPRGFEFAFRIAAFCQPLGNAIAKLPPGELAKFREWFLEFDSAQFDKRIETDVSNGQLDSLANAAIWLAWLEKPHSAYSSHLELAGAIGTPPGRKILPPPMNLGSKPKRMPKLSRLAS